MERFASKIAELSETRSKALGEKNGVVDSPELVTGTLVEMVRWLVLLIHQKTNRLCM